MEVVSDGAGPIPAFNGLFVLLNRVVQVLQQVGIGTPWVQHSWQFQHAAQLVDILHIMQRELGDGRTAMEAASQQPLKRQDADGLSHRVAGNSQRRSQRQFLQLSAGAEFTLENTLTKEGSNLVSDTDAIDMRLIHSNPLQEHSSHEVAKYCAVLFTLSSVEMFTNFSLLLQVSAIATSDSVGPTRHLSDGIIPRTSRSKKEVRKRPAFRPPFRYCHHYAALLALNRNERASQIQDGWTAIMPDQNMVTTCSLRMQ